MALTNAERQKQKEVNTEDTQIQKEGKRETAQQHVKDSPNPKNAINAIESLSAKATDMKKTKSKKVENPPPDEIQVNKQKSKAPFTSQTKKQKYNLKQAKEDPTGTSKCGEWVAAVYNKEWFIGEITKIDILDDIQVNFLKKASKYGNAYKSHQNRDEIWVNKDKVVLVVKSLTVTGKSKRLYQLQEAEQSLIED